MKYDKICLTGAQGTGKTTTLRLLQEQECLKDHVFITEVVRKLARDQGIQINRLGNDESQELIFNTYLDIFHDTPRFVSDRGLTDVMAYTIDGVSNHQVKMGTLEKLESRMEMFTQENPRVLYIYFPIEFPGVEDGVRDTDEEYRKAISDNILDVLDKMGVEFLVVHGSPEERVHQILDMIG